MNYASIPAGKRVDKDSAVLLTKGSSFIQDPVEAIFAMVLIQPDSYDWL